MEIFTKPAILVQKYIRRQDFGIFTVPICKPHIILCGSFVDCNRKQLFGLPFEGTFFRVFSSFSLPEFIMLFPL